VGASERLPQWPPQLILHVIPRWMVTMSRLRVENACVMNERTNERTNESSSSYTFSCY
jgi:hypothetical protein